MLLNLSNHPLSKWSDTQREAAERQFGTIADMQFPQIDPSALLEEVTRIAQECVQNCLEKFAEGASPDETHSPNKLNAVHLMGEFTFTYQFLKRMESLGIPCVASTTERIVTDNPDGSKTTVFKFVQFRPYFQLIENP